MRLEWLYYLKRVVECGSMGKAAKTLFCSQPAISNAIKSIEEELGAPVLNRTANGLTVTRLGEVVLQDTDFILGYMENWKRVAAKETARQPICLFLTGTVPRYYMVNCVMTMKRENPNWDILLKYAPGVRENKPFPRMDSSDVFRFGISYRIPSHIAKAVAFAKEHGMRLAILQEDEFWIFFNKKSPLAAIDREITWDDIRGRDVLLYQDPTHFPYYKKLQEINCRIGPQMWQEENMMMTLSLDENAVAFRPKGAANHNVYMTEGLVAMRPLSSPSMPVNLCLFYPNQERITPTEAAFMARFKKFYPGFQNLD